MARFGQSLLLSACLVLSGSRALADISVEPVSGDTIKLSWWGGRTGMVERTVVRYGVRETRPAPWLDGAEPDGRRFGAPALPFVTCTVLLPPSTRAVEALVVGTREAVPITLDRGMAFNDQPYDGFDMADPVQAQAWAASNAEDADIYFSNRFYPEEPVAFRGRNFRGYRVLDLSFTPYRYNPVTGVLRFCRHMELQIRVEPAAGEDGDVGVRTSERDEEIVRRMVVNEAAMDAYAPPPGPHGRGGPGTNYYVIITSSALATNFEPLRAFHSYDAEHHARIAALEDIYALFPATNPARDSIRSYIMNDLYSNGCDYVLLGGDVHVITTYWGSADTAYSGTQIPVGRFSIDTAQEIANCIAKSTNPVPAGKDRVLLIPRADEYGPTIVAYTNLFVPYLAADTNSALYSAQPINLFPAMDTHTIIWARGHGYYLYPQWAYGWYTPNNTNLQPFGFNFGCSGAVIEWDEHPAEVYQRSRYGNTAYIGTMADVYANSYDVTFFETYFIRGTAPEPCVGDMMLADGTHSLYTLIGDPRFRIVSTSYHARARIAIPGATSFTRSYNIDSGTGYVESAVFEINSFNQCPWVITNVSCPEAFSNHFAFSCLASNATTSVELSFLQVTGLAAAAYGLAWDVRDTTNNFHIKTMNAQLIVTDKNILTDEDFTLTGGTNVLPAGDYVLAEDLVVGDGETVRLEPGVSLYLDWEFGSDWRIRVMPGGKLIALGSATNVISFANPTGSSVPIEIHMTDLMPLSADFRNCYFSAIVDGSNRPVCRFVNCTFSLTAAMPSRPFFPNPLEGTMRNCLFTAGSMGNYGDPGDLTEMDVSYTCIAPSKTNSGFGTPYVPVHHTYGYRTVWGNDLGGFDGRSLGLLSTCINAGDPADPPDPDGTRADIGAYYFDLSGAIRVTNDYPTIQQALDAAAAVTTAVIVAPGEYRERIRVPALPDMNGGLRLIGASETNRPVLVLTNDAGDLLAFDGRAYVENFVIRHTGSGGVGRAVTVLSNNVVGLRNVEFSGNSGNTAVLQVQGGEFDWTCAYLQDVDFANNSSNDTLLSIGPGLSSAITQPWSWYQRGRMTNNTAIGAVFRYAASERYFPTRELEFHDNTASSLIYNGAAGLSETTTLAFCNALFRNNVGDIRTEAAGHTLFENCTFHNNASNMIAAGGSWLALRNSIVWDNTLTITGQLLAEVRVNCTDINSSYPPGGDGNMNTNPLFADAEAGDYRLLRVSPCLDAGDSNSPFANEPEPDGSCIDLGRYGNTPDATSWKRWMDVEIRCPGNMAELTLSCSSGSWYSAEFAESLFSPWTCVTNADATGDVFTVVDPLITERGFYRVHHYRP